MSKGHGRKFPCLSPIGEWVRSFISTNGCFRVFDRFLSSLLGRTYIRHPSLSEVSRDSDQFFACVRDGSLATRVMDVSRVFVQSKCASAVPTACRTEVSCDCGQSERASAVPTA